MFELLHFKKDHFNVVLWMSTGKYHIRQLFSEPFTCLENLPGALVLRIHVHFKLNWLKHIISIQGLNILREEKLCGRNVGGVYFCFGTTNLTIFCFHLPRVNWMMIFFAKMNLRIDNDLVWSCHFQN